LAHKKYQAAKTKLDEEAKSESAAISEEK